MSTLLEAKSRLNKPSTSLYDPGSAKVLEGSKWQIRYGDKSSAGGKVFLDKVGVGNLFVPNQAVEAATTMSASFAKGGSMDGLIGLGMGKLNTIKPKGQPTWFENVRAQLAEPVWTCALKRRASGSFDFGFIDQKKYKGDIAWTPVQGTKGFWNFTVSGFAIGDGPVQQLKSGAVADTGSSLWYAPSAMTDAYWQKVPGTRFDNIQGGYTFPCSTNLPDIQIVIENKKFTIAGPNMNYQRLSTSTCFGGLQRNTGMPFSIYGDVFLKGLLVIFEQAPDKPQRIGFAQGAF